MKQVFKLVLACAVGILPMSVGAKDSEAAEVRKMIDKVKSALAGRKFAGSTFILG